MPFKLPISYAFEQCSKIFLIMLHCSPSFFLNADNLAEVNNEYNAKRETIFTIIIQEQAEKLGGSGIRLWCNSLSR